MLSKDIPVTGWGLTLVAVYLPSLGRASRAWHCVRMVFASVQALCKAEPCVVRVQWYSRTGRERDAPRDSRLLRKARRHKVSKRQQRVDHPAHRAGEAQGMGKGDPGYASLLIKHLPPIHRRSRVSFLSARKTKARAALVALPLTRCPKEFSSGADRRCAEQLQGLRLSFHFREAAKRHQTL